MESIKNGFSVGTVGTVAGWTGASVFSEEEQ